MSELKSTAWSAIKAFGTILLTMAVLGSSASAECSACTFVDSWIKGTINSIFSGDSQSEGEGADFPGQLNLEIKSAPTEDSMVDERNSVSDMLVSPFEVVEKDIILDGSDGPLSFIPGAVHIVYRDFVDNNNTASLKNISEIAQILGDAGISRDDPLVVYGECQPCGGGPSTATYVYWLLRFIGHDDVKVLNGGIDAWIQAGMPVQNSSAIRPKTTYSPLSRPGLYATYDYVKNGGVQIVDARSGEEFESGSIPGAINIPYDEVLDGKMIRDEIELECIFRNLTKERPVVVFTTTGIKASAVWFALTMIGYDAKMYTYKDWGKEKREERRQLQELNKSK